MKPHSFNPDLQFPDVYERERSVSAGDNRNAGVDQDIVAIHVLEAHRTSRELDQVG